MSGYDRFVRIMPTKSAEQVLEDLDENGRERSEIERFVYRYFRDRPSLEYMIRSGRMLSNGGWGGWGPDDSGHRYPWPPNGVFVENWGGRVYPTYVVSEEGPKDG